MPSCAPNVASLRERLPALQSCQVAEREFSYREISRVAQFPKERDSRPVLLLLHGIGSGSASWFFQFQSLHHEFRILALDTPGYGASTPLLESEPMPVDYARVLHQFVAAMKLPPVFLLGHSLGALIGAAYAREFPEEIRGLLLADPALGYGTHSPEVRTTMIRQRLEIMTRLGPAGMAKERARNLVLPSSPEVIRSVVEEVMAELIPEGYAQAVRMLAKGDLLTDLIALRHSGNMPITVCWGDTDAVTPPSQCLQAAEAAGVPGTVIESAGHACYLDNPRSFDAWVRSFRQGIDG